ncbi:MAG: tRNA uridine(34) 5-carboxymethylaminomethyl modification radical SAM/GNAT enzyme Elp3, partial [Candidatus Roizmanbacteria bacterium]|nr:tRNA uridine(34) 5-carboxymethylaminomethyl modification radical SAM/GNAT enzyme Elp3 [Candidatus Roizmanbacteria bacterium]
NFPKQFEPTLLSLLILLQDEWKNSSEKKQYDWQKLIRKKIKNDPYKTLFTGKMPPFWWLQLMLYRHEKLFEKEFIEHIHMTLIKTKIRSISGIVPLTLFTKGVACPFNCVYCPSEPNMPKSYLSDEPAVMRAIRNKFEPFAQIESRLIMFTLSNHSIDKVEIIIKGGTFSFLPRRYRTFFLKKIFEGCNTDTLQMLKSGTKNHLSSLTLEKAQVQNETAPSRIIGINIETRPDYIDTKEIQYLRKLGVTHVELGVQTLSNAIYTKIKRGHSTDAVVQATQLLKDAGFKIGYHLMLNLPGSTPETDIQMLHQAFFDHSFQPDHLKLYPTTVTKFSKLADWYKTGEYKPYPLPELINTITTFKKDIVPPWVRIGRLTRDITTTMMDAQLFPPNLRELVQKEMVKHHIECQCIRCREIQLQKPTLPITTRIITYDSAGGKEYFIEKIDSQQKCMGFIRLRFPSYLFNKNSKSLFPSLKDSAIIRELHVYGKAMEIGENDTKATQHKGLGEELLTIAEEITKKEGHTKLAIISGIGVRGYYRKRGYELEDTYMIKKIF